MILEYFNREKVHLQNPRMSRKIPAFSKFILQFKERDFMEGIFKFWRNKDLKTFDVEKMWYVYKF